VLAKGLMVLPSSPGVDVSDPSALAAGACGFGELQLEKAPALLRPKVGGAEDTAMGSRGCWELGRRADSVALAMAMRS